MSESTISEALRLLVDERDRLDRAIQTLQGAAAPAPRRGRPPGSKSKKKRRGRPPMSAAEKQAASERMKRYWAKRRRAAKKESLDLASAASR